MGMVMEKITVNRSKLKKWDDNSDGRISYEELKRGVDGSVAPKTLKQVFKRADLDRVSQNNDKKSLPASCWNRTSDLLFTRQTLCH